MTDNLFIQEDHTKDAEIKFCPLLQKTCLGDQCQWWTYDFMEDRRSYRFNCAVTMIAQGLTDEALLKIKGK